MKEKRLGVRKRVVVKNAHGGGKNAWWLTSRTSLVLLRSTYMAVVDLEE